MHELITEAIPIYSSVNPDSKEKIVDLFTEKLGRIRARVVGGAKTTSRLSPHLNTLSLTTVRLVKKNSFVVTDALTMGDYKWPRENVEALGRALDVAFAMRSLLPMLAPDPELWHFLVSSFKSGNLNYKIFLKILGYDPCLASCFFCEQRSVESFLISDLLFVCARCSHKSTQKNLMIKVV